jgi:hypothetical protein
MYKKLKKNKSLNSDFKKNLNFSSKKSVQFVFFRERKKNYHNLFG